MKDLENREDFEALTLRYLDPLYRFALILTQNQDSAEDLVQETYLRAYRFFDRFEPGTRLKAWMMTIMRNIFINQYHHRSKELLVSDFDEDEGFESWPGISFSSEDRDLRNQIVKHDIEKALAALPEHLRVIILLKDMEGLDYKEIAAALDCPLGTVMSRLFRARNQLKKLLKGYERRPSPVRDSIGEETV
ncbi:MAG TPA: sigma-70 family RNA polymerase sigma factor [Candidatus Manganitrophaceae bacterium]